MTFAWPLAFILLVIPLGMLGWEIVRRRSAGTDTRPKIMRAHAAQRSLKLAPADAHRRSIRRPRLWLVVGLALAVAAFARPQWGLLDEEVFDQSREIIVAVDLSRSMLAQDVKPSRLERSKLLIQAMLERLQGERVGLLLFAGTAFLQSPLSADYEILTEFLPALSPQTLPEGGTNYEALITTAAQAFAGASAADRFLIVLSDGEATDEDWKSHIDELKDKGVRVIGLGVGTPLGAVIPDGSGGLVKDEKGAVVLSKLETNTLQELCTATGGVYRDASTWLDLNTLLQSTVESGRKGAFIEKSRVRKAERFQWFLGPAFAFLLLSFAREFPVRPRPRELQLDSPAPGRASEGAALALLALGLGLFGLAAAPRVAALEAVRPISPPPAADAGEPVDAGQAPGGGSGVDVNPGLAPLTETVERLARKPKRTAGDWSEMAENTLKYGGHFQEQKQAVPEGPVNDALAAVDAGEAQDRRAADWPKLRQALQDLLVKPPEPPPPPDDQKQDQKSEQNQDGQKKDGDQGEKGSPQQGDNQNPEDNPDGQDGDQKNDQDQPADMNPNGEEAFGDMDAQPGEITPKDPQNQQVGNSREAKPIEVDPSLTLPLQKLEQLKNQDSPARLFQLMEGPPKGDENKNKKDW